MPSKLPEITIIQDSREQTPWIFDVEDKKPGKCQVVGTEVTGLDAGDYTIKGYESILRIERKASFGELFGNYTPVANRDRFIREMEKLRDIQYKYLIVETQISKEMLALTIPQFKSGLPISRLFKWTLDLQKEYGIIPLFVGDAGQKTARYIMEWVVH